MLISIRRLVYYYRFTLSKYLFISRYMFTFQLSSLSSIIITKKNKNHDNYYSIIILQIAGFHMPNYKNIMNSSYFSRWQLYYNCIIFSFEHAFMYEFTTSINVSSTGSGSG